MNTLLLSTLSRLAIPLLIITIVLVVTRMRGLSWSDDIGLKSPRTAHWAVWLACWILWIAFGERMIAAFGMETPAPWADFRFSSLCCESPPSGWPAPYQRNW